MAYHTHTPFRPPSFLFGWFFRRKSYGFFKIDRLRTKLGHSNESVMPYYLLQLLVSILEKFHTSGSLIISNTTVIVNGQGVRISDAGLEETSNFVRGRKRKQLFITLLLLLICCTRFVYPAFSNLAVPLGFLCAFWARAQRPNISRRREGDESHTVSFFFFLSDYFFRI